jgi:hypothetical protein
MVRFLAVSSTWIDTRFSSSTSSGTFRLNESRPAYFFGSFQSDMNDRVLLSLRISPLNNGHRSFPDAMAPSAIIDRLIHHGSVFEFTGVSQRLKSRTSKGRVYEDCSYDVRAQACAPIFQPCSPLEKAYVSSPVRSTKNRTPEEFARGLQIMLPLQLSAA